MNDIFLKCQILMLFSLLECKKRKSRYYSKRKDCIIKRKFCTEKCTHTSLKDLPITLNNHDQHGLLLIEVPCLPISVLCNLDLEALR